MKSNNNNYYMIIYDNIEQQSIVQHSSITKQPWFHMSHIATNSNEPQNPFRSQPPAPAADAHGAPMFAAQRPPPWSFWRHRCEGRGPAWAEGLSGTHNSWECRENGWEQIMGCKCSERLGKMMKNECHKYCKELSQWPRPKPLIGKMIRKMMVLN